MTIGKIEKIYLDKVIEICLAWRRKETQIAKASPA